MKIKIIKISEEVLWPMVENSIDGSRKDTPQRNVFFMSGHNHRFKITKKFKFYNVNSLRTEILNFLIARNKWKIL